MGNVKVKVVKRYNDLVLKEIKKPGDTFEVTEERAKHLVTQGMVEIVTEAKGSKKG